MMKYRKRIMAILIISMLLPANVSMGADPNQAGIQEESKETAQKQTNMTEETKEQEQSDTVEQTETAEQTEAVAPTEENTESTEDQTTKLSEEPTEEPTEEQTEDIIFSGVEMPEEEEEETAAKEILDDGREHNTDGADPNAQVSGYVPNDNFKVVVEPEKLTDDIRFQTVKKDYALVKIKTVNAYAKPDEKAEKVGILKANDLCFVLETIDENWLYIESGNVRGFVKKDSLNTSKDVGERIKKRGENTYSFGNSLVEYNKNPAWTYVKKTTGFTQIAKKFALSKTIDLNIRTGKSTDAKIVGKLNKEDLCYVLEDTKSEWIFVESGLVRGFVKKEYLLQGEEALNIVKKEGEENLRLAKEIVPPDKNEAFYYTFTSVEPGRTHKLKFLGNFTLTSYCSCPSCCGKWSGGMAAGGVYPVQGRTIAMYGVPFGTKLVVNNQVYIVEDRGTPYGHIDFYRVYHADAAAFGKQKADVYLLEE